METEHLETLHALLSEIPLSAIQEALGGVKTSGKRVLAAAVALAEELDEDPFISEEDLEE